MNNNQFPIYLHLSQTNTWLKIINDHSFFEVKTLGEFYFKNKYSDDVLPMRNHISDLIENEAALRISEKDYLDVFKKIEQTKVFKEL